MADTVPIRKTPSIFDEMNELQDRIMRRAYELFEHNGSKLGSDLENWTQAEREIVWKPAFELTEKNGKFQLEAAVSGLNPKDIDIEVTLEDIVLKAETQHQHKEDKGTIHYCEFESGKMFRAIHLPKKIDPDKVKAEFKNGLLTVHLPKSEHAKPKQIEVNVA